LFLVSPFIFYTHTNPLVHRIAFHRPVNTLVNWENEFAVWLKSSELLQLTATKGVPQVPIYCPNNQTTRMAKIKVVEKWHTDGGVLLVTFGVFRSLASEDSSFLCEASTRAFLR